MSLRNFPLSNKIETRTQNTKNQNHLIHKASTDHTKSFAWKVMVVPIALITATSSCVIIPAESGTSNAEDVQKHLKC